MADTTSVELRFVPRGFGIGIVHCITDVSGLCYWEKCIRAARASAEEFNIDTFRRYMKGRKPGGGGGGGRKVTRHGNVLVNSTWHQASFW